MDEFFFGSTSQNDTLGMSNDELVAFIDSELLSDTRVGEIQIDLPDVHPPEDPWPEFEQTKRTDIQDTQTFLNRFRVPFGGIVDVRSPDDILDHLFPHRPRPREQKNIRDPDNILDYLLPKRAKAKDQENIRDPDSTIEHIFRQCSIPFSPPDYQLKHDYGSWIGVIETMECPLHQAAIEHNYPYCSPPAVGCSGSLDDVCEQHQLPSLYDEHNQLTIAYTTNPWPFTPDTTVTNSEEQLITSAWNFLRDNEDVVRWVVCVVIGETTANCVSQHILSGQQRFIFDDYPPIIHRSHDMWSEWIDKDIHINSGDWGVTWNVLLNNFDTGLRDNDYKKVMCSIVWVAGLSLHEVVHGCLPFLTEEFDKPGSCDQPYIVMSSFWWAMGNRFPCVRGALNCSSFGDDCYWLNDDYRSCSESQ